MTYGRCGDSVASDGLKWCFMDVIATHAVLTTPPSRMEGAFLNIAVPF